MNVKRGRTGEPRFMRAYEDHRIFCKRYPRRRKTKTANLWHWSDVVARTIRGEESRRELLSAQSDSAKRDCANAAEYTKLRVPEMSRMHARKWSSTQITYGAVRGRVRNRSDSARWYFRRHIQCVAANPRAARVLHHGNDHPGCARRTAIRKVDQLRTPDQQHLLRQRELLCERDLHQTRYARTFQKMHGPPGCPGTQQPLGCESGKSRTGNAAGSTVER